jgi:hypothetical protein
VHYCERPRGIYESLSPESSETLTSPLSHVLRRCGLFQKISPTAGFPREKTKATTGLPRSYCGRIAATILMPDLRVTTNTAHDLQSVTTYLLSSSYPDSRRMQSTVRPDRSINPRAVRILLLPSSGSRRVLFHVSLLFPALVRWFTQRAARQHSNKTTSPQWPSLLDPAPCVRTIAASHDTRLRPQVL